MNDDPSKRSSIATDPDFLPDADFRIVAVDAPVMLWLTNADGKVIFTNSKWMKFVGTPPGASAGGDTWVKALHPDDLAPCMKTFEEAFAARKAFEMEYRLRRADGQYRHVLDFGEPFISRDGRFAGFIGSSSDITDRKNHEIQLRLSQQELTLHNREMQLINDLNSYLQVCRTLEETHPIIAHYARRIFAGGTGAFYLFDDNHTTVTRVAGWGELACFSAGPVSPDDCWALRQGKMHAVAGVGDEIVCKHLDADPVPGYVCAPAIAQGEMIGVLSVTLGPGTDDDAIALDHRSTKSKTRLISMAADNLAMALVSLKLREALRDRSVRDPLTRLFNRRYLEETLTRELAGSQRAACDLSVIMMDVDHFKSFNDTHGHDVGDAVLVQIADIVRSKLRASDVPCRYGGEELLVVMPGASKETAIIRAQTIRQAIEGHEFHCHGKKLAGVTMSMGVAVYPVDGTASAELLKAADMALYQAKENGRNQVVGAASAVEGSDGI